MKTENWFHWLKNQFAAHMLRRVLAVSVIAILALASIVSGQDFEWIRQIDGTAPAEDRMNAVNFNGNLYVAGTTSGILPGQSSAGPGGQGVFVRKYNANGIEIWTRQFGTSFEDWARGIAVDATGIYVTGITYGTFSGQTFAGYIDAFVRKYDINGNEVWTRQFGTPSHDQPFGIATDATGIYVVGGTGGDLPGYTNAGHTDAFVRKYDVNGTEIWTRQIGTTSHEYAYSVFANATGVYLAGTTEGSLPGQTNTGGGDVFVQKYAANGAEVWTRQFGTSAREEGWAIAGDATNLYVAGRTEGYFPGQLNTGSNGAFVRKCDLNGNEVWTRQFGTLVPMWPPVEWAYGVSVDASGIYVAGTMSKSPLGPGGTVDFDAYVRKYDVNGNEVWTHLFGTLASDFGMGVSADVTGVYVVGETNGTFQGQSRVGAGDERDAFVRKYDVNGNETWTHQIGTLSPSYEQATAVDANGGIYVAGYFHGALSGQASAGLYDVFVRKYDASGTEIWTRAFGSPEYDFAFGIAADVSGVYVTGTTQGSLPGQSSVGGADVFVRKYDANGTEIWTRQFGTSSYEFTPSISVDASGVYVTGATQGTFPGEIASGSTDAFVRKYDLNGNEIWTRQFGTSSSDNANGIAAEATGIYITGQTSGTFDGQTNAGSGDAYVRKYDTNGNEIWTRQFGTSSNDRGRGIATDANGIYVAGETNGIFPGQNSGQIFVRKYDVNGTEAWTRQFGASYFESANGIAVNATGIYVTGFTLGALPGQVNAGGTDPFVRKYDTNGNEVWTRQFGTWFDEDAKGIAVDATGIYVAGWTPGDLTTPNFFGSGNMDAFVVKIGNNQPPAVVADGPYSVNEGASVTVTASGNDPENEPLTYAWDLDNNGSFETSGQSTTFSAASLDGPSSHTIKVQVTDNGNLAATAQATVNVSNVAPTASFANTSGTIIFGQSATLAFSNQFDPSAADVTAGFKYSFDCTNDGTFEVVDAAAPTNSTCSYPTSGIFIPRGRIKDEDGGFTDYTVQIKVLTPREAVQNLIAQVQALNKPQGNGLIGKLNVVINRLDGNRIDKAIAMLQQFIDQVNVFMSNGTFTVAEGQPLIDAANAIIAALSNPAQAAAAGLKKDAREGLAAVALPTAFQLEQNSPNPFNPTTTIQFAVPRESFVRLKVYNFNGQEVATLIDRQVAAGTYKVNWDASRLASGFYLYRLEAEGFAQTKKLVLMK